MSKEESLNKKVARKIRAIKSLLITADNYVVCRDLMLEGIQEDIKKEKFIGERND